MSKQTDWRKKRLKEAYKNLKYELESIMADEDDPKTYKDELKQIKKSIDNIIDSQLKKK